MNYQERFLFENQIASLSFGNGIEHTANDNPVVICLHGYLDNAASFIPLIEALEGLSGVAIDLAGHGKSAHRPANQHYALLDYVADLHTLISYYQLENVVLIGHSLGGIVSTIVAAAFPERVRQVIAIESIGPLTQSEESSVEQIRASILSQVKARAAIKHPASIEQIVAARMRVSDLKAWQAEIILKRNVEDKDGQLQWRTDKRLRTQSYLRFTEKQALNVIENLQCPFHLVLGNQGFTKIKKLLETRQQAFKQFTCVEFNGGHHVHMDSPKALASFIQKCLESGFDERTGKRLDF
uniref:alpha/beta fold hydrolase n=1 Tax=Ningiella ruwaisensis TaxID=2364274 RepID=UPI0014479C56|nr:alpha/beta hydrolase [Ningiella ruwaisensis]